MDHVSPPARTRPVLRPGVEPGQAVAALGRVLASDTFARSPRSREFLAFVAAEVLGGRGEALHERTVARYALGRSEDFDGRESSIARVRATRVRQSLSDYYAGVGRGDPVRIAIPRGTYAPTFAPARRDGRPTPSAAGLGPNSVAVVQVDPHGNPAGPAGVCAHALAGELARFPGLTVVLASRRHAADAASLARELEARFVLLCSMTVSEAVARVRLQLTDSAQARLIWSREEEVDVAHASGARLGRWAAEVAAQIGDYAGLILRHLQTEDDPTGGTEFRARLAFYRHIAEGHVASMLTARSALEDAVEAGSTARDIRAKLAFILAVLVLNGPPLDDPEADRDRARHEARSVVDQEPTDVLARLALAALALGQREWEEARRGALLAAELSPSHPSHLFTAGAVLAAAGDWESGVRLMRRSFELNPLHPAYQHANLALERLLERDFAAALGEASIVDEGGGVWGPFCRALALEGLGHGEWAGTEMAAALEFAPDLFENPEAFLSEFVITPGQRDTLLSLINAVRQHTGLPG